LLRSEEASGRREPRGGLYCSRCSAILSEAGAFRVEEAWRRKEEIVERVVRKLVELAPEVLEKALSRGPWRR